MNDYSPARHRIPWARLLTESVLIIASILLAFAIDAWWQERGERALEIQQLQSLRESIRSSQTSANDGERQNAMRVALLEDLLENPEALQGLPLATTDSLLFDALFLMWPWTERITAFEDLRSSGQLSLIGSQELRIALQQMDVDSEDLREISEATIRAQERMLDPVLAARTNVLQLKRSYYREPNPGMPTRDHSGFLSSTEVQGLVAHKAVLTSGVANFYQTLHDSMERAIELIDERLETLGVSPAG